jgi:hypothetical protein
MSRAIAKQIHDEKQGLAMGQPEIEVADSLFNSYMSFIDESRMTHRM